MDVLFLGERAGGSAEYLRRSLLLLGHTVTHVDASAALPPDLGRRDVYIISDYPAKNIGGGHAAEIAAHVRDGARLLMIGGWDSFNGKGSAYFGHPVADILPVRLDATDDRRNIPQGLIISIDPSCRNVAGAGDLIDSQPPVVCGYNHATPMSGARVIAVMRPVSSDGVSARLLDPVPFVVKQSVGRGVSVACLTDLAPHWCGGLVDWGAERISIAPFEIGALFPKFVQFLLTA